LSDIANIVLIPTLMLLGIVLGRIKIGLKASHLEFLIINFTAPALMLTEIVKADLNSFSLGGVVGISLAYVALCFALSYVLSRNFNRRERGTIVFNSTFFNSVFLPFPLIYAFYGDLSIALMFGLPVMIIHNSFGVFLASYWGHGKVGKKVLVKAVTFPPLIGFLIGVLVKSAFAGFAATAAFGWLHEFGLLTIYLSLVFVGLAIPLSKESVLVFRNRVTGLITLNRLLVSPAIALALIAAFNPTELVRNNILIMALMPPAVTNLIIISRFGLDLKSTCQSVFLPTLMSLGIIFALRVLTII